MSAWFIYFILMLDNFRGVIISLMLMLVGVALVLFFCHMAAREKEIWNGKSFNWVKLRHYGATVALFSVLVLLLGITPSTKQAVIIFGLSEITQSEKVSEISGKSLKLLEKYLDESLKEDKK